jgi:hypothetical protein
VRRCVRAGGEWPGPEQEGSGPALLDHRHDVDHRRGDRLERQRDQGRREPPGVEVPVHDALDQPPGPDHHSGGARRLHQHGAGTGHGEPGAALPQQLEEERLAPEPTGESVGDPHEGTLTSI